MSSGREVSQPEWSPGSLRGEGRQSLGPGDTVSGAGSTAASSALEKEQLERAGESEEGVLPNKERESQEGGVAGRANSSETLWWRGQDCGSRSQPA